MRRDRTEVRSLGRRRVWLQREEIEAGDHAANAITAFSRLHRAQACA
ncbi:uncharacterized protein J3R85_001237 [Psidium guajava]|nr:uncharacterized protein J3R85_001237 [Psidium guajava]